MTTHADLYQKAGLPVPGLTLIRLSTVLVPLAGLWLEGILLPSGDIGDVEALDPFFPTPFHRPLCIALCFVALWATYVLRPGAEVNDRWLKQLDLAQVLLGFGMGFSFYYSLALVPATPLFFMLILWLGLGLTGFSPYLYFLGTWSLLLRIRQVVVATGRHPRHGRGRVAGGFFAGLALISGMDLWSQYWIGVIQRATSLDPEVAAAEVPTVRRFYSEEELLGFCYVPLVDHGVLMGVRGPQMRFAWSGDSVERFRKLYYRVTGVPFNEVPPPRVGRFDTSGRWEDSWTVNVHSDREVGGERVEGRVHSLTLLASTMEGVVDPRTASAHLRWTMELKNASSNAREARMVIGLPPDAAASELVLWVNGKPQKAAFGGRAETRKAYQSVAVVQRRDPALLSTMGPDRLLLQVFPVPANAEARVAIEITAPLFLEKDRALLRLPHLLQRNYEIGHLTHQLDLRAEGGVPLESRIAPSPSSAVPDPSAAPGTVKIRVSDGVLTDVTSGTIAIGGAAIPAGPVLGAAPEGGGAERHEQQLEGPLPGAVPQKLWIVIDGSRSVGRARIDWAKLFAAMPADPAVEVLVASDVTRRWSGKLKDSALAGWLQQTPFIGGVDPVATLGLALAEATTARDGVVLWLHGQQPFVDDDVTELPGSWPVSSAPLVSLAVDPGTNVLLAARGDEAPFAVAPRLGALDGDLERALLGCGRIRRGTAPVTEITLASPFSDRARIYRPVVATPPDAPGSEDVSRLAVLAAARALLKEGKDAESAKLAVAARLVTPVTGAVVLETREDYEKNGLEPPGDAPAEGKAVPEPEILVLILVGYALLRRRRG